MIGIHLRGKALLILCAFLVIADYVIAKVKVEKINETKLISEEQLKKQIGFVVSPDSKHYACVVNIDGKTCLIRDGVEGARYDDIIIKSLRFSPNSQSLIYFAKKGVKYCAVFDGQEGPLYGNMYLGIVFSADGKRLAYNLSEGGKFPLVVDGVVSSLGSGAVYKRFSPDGKHLAYAQINKNKVGLVVDDKVVADEVVAWENHLKVGDFDDKVVVSFSKNGGRVSWGEFDGVKTIIYVDAKKDGVYDKVLHLPVFSENGRSVAYVAVKNNQWYVVCNGNPELIPDKAAIVVLSPDGNDVVYLGLSGGKCYIVKNGSKISSLYNDIDPYSIHFSGDSKHMMFSAKDNQNKWVLVVDGKEGAHYDSIVGDPKFSPKGGRYIYSASRNGKQFVVVDGHESKGYDSAFGGVFSVDGAHYAYKARDGKKWLILLDDDEVLNVEDQKSEIVFESFNKFHFIEEKAGSVCLREVTFVFQE
jgi:Tol biopolymer transport system component